MKTVKTVIRVIHLVGSFIIFVLTGACGLEKQHSDAVPEFVSMHCDPNFNPTDAGGNVVKPRAGETWLIVDTTARGVVSQEYRGGDSIYATGDTARGGVNPVASAFVIEPTNGGLGLVEKDAFVWRLNASYHGPLYFSTDGENWEQMN